MAKGPLSGLKVIEYCSFVAGPFCGKLLADMGAEVIKVEDIGGDEARKRGPFLGDNVDSELSGLYLYNNTNKKGITLNLETGRGREIIKKLISEADVFIEDKKPGEMERLGLSYDILKHMNPSLIMASISPFGQYGPYRDYKAYGLNTYHSSGAGYVLPSASPNADREPIKGGGYVGESDIGSSAALSIVGALFWRNAGGTGQYIDISKQESEMALERMNIVRYYMLGTSPSRVGVNRVRDTLLKCRDGGYVIVVLYPKKQWDGLVEALGTPEWTQEEKFSRRELRDANFKDLKLYLGEEALKYDTEELFFKIQAHGTACAPICSAEQVYNSPQTKAREFFIEMDHPKAGKLMYPGIPYKLSKSAPENNHGAPLLGQHNEEVYCSRLGYSKEDLIKFKASGII